MEIEDWFVDAVVTCTRPVKTKKRHTQGRADSSIVKTLSLEGVSQMDSILPERLLALVRPGNNLVLRRIRSLKRCVEACGCKIMTPRYACNLAPGCISSEPTFAGLRKKTKKNRKQGAPKKGSQKKGKRGFLWQSLTSLLCRARFFAEHAPVQSTLLCRAFFSAERAPLQSRPSSLFRGGFPNGFYST